MKKFICLFFAFLIFVQASSFGAAPTYVSTFECIGIYWNPVSTGALADTCKVQYRKQGDGIWKQGFPLVYYNRTDGGASYLGGKYRGSLVNLTSNTTYEISLKLLSNADSATFTAKTWTETFPIKTTIELPATSSTTLNVTTSGTSTGYILYTPKSGSTATIDVNSNADNCISIQASYIIIRGVTLKNPRINGILLGGVHDIVIEKCDISGWGRISSSYGGVEQDAAVRSTSSSVTRIIVQRTKIHHPRADANSWLEPVVNTHPEGPQCISFLNGDGNHVFRYNEAYSDTAHKYNDIFGGGNNASYKGFPNRDTDVYGNYLSHEWDDALEIEGANRNVRVWGNFIDTCASAITSASTSIGPYYAWRNVVNVSQWGPDYTIQTGTYFNGSPGEFFKCGGASIDSFMGGQIYIFHNTLLQPPGPSPSYSCGVGHWGIGNGPVRNVYSRNNILHMRMSSEPSILEGDATCNYNYDLFNGTVSGPSPLETKGKKGVPAYAVKTFDTVTKKGTFQLSSTSLGFDQGYPIPNFSDGFNGIAPDMGAHEAGTLPMEFGVNAYLSGSDIESFPTQKPSGSIENINSIISNIRTESKCITFFVQLKNSANWSLDLYNITGKKIWGYKNKTEAGLYSLKYENKTIPQGQYFAKLKQDNIQTISRFVVIK